MPRSGLVSVTWAPDTAAPLGSVTVPVIEAVSCAKAANETERTMPNHNTRDFIANPLDNGATADGDC